MTDDMIWLRLGRVAPDQLTQTRQTLHQAAQTVCATAETLLDPAEDGHHTNILWDVEHGGFVGRPLAQGHRVFLDIRWFRAGLRTKEGTQTDSIELEGQTLAQALEALAQTLRDAGYDLPTDGLKHPPYDLPLKLDAPLSRPDTNHARELARWYHDATLLLTQVSNTQPGASEVRGWPHHFDLATLITLDPDAGQEKGRSIGVGLSPGDSTLAEPYIYVTPWPYPGADVVLGDLPHGGMWHREGWTGALLPGHTLTSLETADGQHHAMEAFIHTAIALCRDLLDDGAAT
ncbi:MAG: DUF5996 family protein [Myxococcota bacterium]